MRRFSYTLNRAFLVITGSFAAYLFAAAFLSIAAVPVKAEQCETSRQIYLQYSPIHADFVVPIDYLQARDLEGIELPGRPEYLVIGMGDRDIYVNTPTWGDLKARYALKALFVPSPRAMHVEPAYRKSSAWVTVDLCDGQFESLKAYILDSFKRTESGSVMIIPDMTYTGRDRFFEASGVYTLFNSCNNWANGGLKAAGQKTSIWSPFSQGVIFHAKKNAR